MATRGGGRCGSRNSSSAPPLRQGFDHHHGALLGARAVLLAGHDAKEDGFAGLQHAQRLQPDRRVGTRTADEALDRAVGVDDGAVARSRAAGRGAAHDDHLHERRSHCGGSVVPRCIASQTRAGVTGMSTWRTPNGSSASTTALTTAGGEPTFDDSPTPFAPSGW